MVFIKANLSSSCTGAEHSDLNEPAHDRASAAYPARRKEPLSMITRWGGLWR